MRGRNRTGNDSCYMDPKLRLPITSGWAAGRLVVAWAARFTGFVRCQSCQLIDG
jgi:hypothetical protein